MNLTPEQRSFVDAVLKPLGDDASRRDLLEESLVLATTLASPPQGDPVEVASARMDTKAKSFALRRRLSQVALVVTVLVIPWLSWLTLESRTSFKRLLASVPFADDIIPSEVVDIILGDHGDSEAACVRMISGRIPADWRLVAMGDLGASDPVSRWKAVWDAHPDDPAHFMAYSAEVRSATREWPADLVETGERLDPGNGWFRLLRAASRIEEAVEPPVRIRSASAKSAVPSAPTVKDAALLNEILSELERVVSMPRLDDYQKNLNTERLRGWPASVDYPDQVLSMLFRFQHPEVRMSSPSELRQLANFFSAAAHQAGASGDRASLERIATLFQRTFRKLAENPALMHQRMMASATMVEGGRSISSAYTLLGDSPKALAFSSLDGLDRRKAPRVAPAPDALSEGRGSQFTSMMYSGELPGTTPVSERELRGGRLAEYAMAERLLFHELTLLFGLLLGVVLSLNLRNRKASGQLGARLPDLLTLGDRLLIAMMGNALPALVYVAVVHAPWSRLRDFTINPWHFDLMLMQVAALPVAVILCTLQAIRWRLGRRGAVLALGWNGFDPGWWLVPMALSAIPAVEYLPGMFQKWSLDEDWATMAAWSLIGLPCAWLFVLAVGHLRASEERRVHRSAVLSALGPFMTGAFILAAMATQAIHEVERHWTRQIDFEAVTAERIAFESRVSREHADWLQAEQLRHLRALE